MLRWLRDRKKQKRGPLSGEGTDDYGFHSSDKNQDEKLYHIYEEIPDLPRYTKQHGIDVETHDTSSTAIPAQDSCFDRSLVFSSDTLRKYIIDSQEATTEKSSKRDGPYMIVPILNCGSKEEEKPPLPPPNEKKPEFACALVGRRNSSLSRSAESGVEVSYDSSESQGSEKNFDELFAEGESRRKQPFATVSSSKSASRHGRHAREASMDASDTGCEYDMSTSSESDHANYEYYLNKIEQNLEHKCKIREIIQQCVPEEEESDSDSLTTVSSVSGCSSVRTARLTSGHRSTDIESDEGTLADHSESENSSGYYESFGAGKRKVSNSAFLPEGEVRLTRNCGLTSNHISGESQRQHYIKNKRKTASKKCRHRNVDALSLCLPATSPALTEVNHGNMAALGLCVSDKGAFRTVNKSRSKSHGHLAKGISLSQLYRRPKTNKDPPPVKLDIYEPLPGSSLYGVGDKVSQSSTSVDTEGREVYSPPPSVTDFATRNPGLPSKCSMARGLGSTNVYSSVGSQNRLLSDLIIMNYDRQLFIH